MANRVLNKQLNAKLEELRDRPNTTYNRGILHGFLLAIMTEGKIDRSEAQDILEQFGEKPTV